MPGLRELTKEGSSGVLMSTFPTVSATAWTSITTGANPGKHGVFDFVRVDKNLRQSLCHSMSKMTHDMWDYLEGSIVANVPVTYPPRKIRGIMISGMGTPSPKSEFTYPKSYKKKIQQVVPDYSPELDWQDYRGRLDEFYEDIQEVTEQKVRLFWHLFSLDWNLLFFVITETDRIQHVLWGTRKLVEYYRRIDRFLVDVAKEIQGENIILVLISDHGFRSVRKVLYINYLLKELGLARTREARLSGWLERGGITKSHLWAPLRRSGLTRLHSRIPPKILHILRKSIPGESNIEYDFNLDETKAVMIGKGGIYLSKRDNSIVSDKEPDSTAKSIAENLMDVRDPETGDRVIERTYQNSELYSGPFSDWGPDLVAVPSQDYILVWRMAKKAVEASSFQKGDHDPEGIFLIRGEDVREDTAIAETTVYDIAPTILHILGVSVPDSMDGRVIREVFEHESSLDRPALRRRLSEVERVMHKVMTMRALGKI